MTVRELAPPQPSPAGPRRSRLRTLAGELAKFGVVGAAAYIVDVLVFNTLLYGGGHGVLHAKPLTAKVVSVLAASTVAYLGNRQWTFRSRDRSGVRREYLLFLVLNGVGLALALACLATSRYVLGLASPLADNVSANGVGLVLGTAFRFWAYRRFVFRQDGGPGREAPAA